MTLTDKVTAVEAVFLELDATIAGFQSRSGLFCKHGCGKCCFKPDIEATVLEFLPFAKYLHARDAADVWLEKLKSSDAPVCAILNPDQSGAGLCSEYPHRGLICRLFGYSARTNKYNRKELVTCTIIRTEQAGAVASSERAIEQGGEVPLMNAYYMQLHAIDPDMTRDFFPINEAIRRAIEAVLHYYAYRDSDEL